MNEFFMAMIPPTTTHQEKRAVICADNKIRFYEYEKLKAARIKLMAHLHKFIPEEPITGPIRLYVKWCYPINNGKKDGQWKTTKPDLDNAQKLLQDCMSDIGFWKDDKQIASLICEKFWAKIPGIYIKIEKLE